MIMQYHYSVRDGILRPQRRFWLAQDNHLADEIVVTSDDEDPARLDYFLEFVCYNVRNVPKREYVSPVLQYWEGGIRFLVPSQLTHYEGHVDMQLVGMSKQDRSRVFKSNDHYAHAYYVKASVGALEGHLDDTPNLLTEVVRALEEFRQAKDGVIRDFEQAAHNDLGKLLSAYRFCSVSFCVAGVVKERVTLLQGAKITPPRITLPEGCVADGGWYAADSDLPWRFETDTISRDVTLELNFMTEGTVVIGGIVQSCSTRSGELYLPRYCNGRRVTGVADGGRRLTSSKYLTVYVPDTITQIDSFAATAFVRRFVVHRDNPVLVADEAGALYSRDGITLLKLPDIASQTETILDERTRVVAPYACAGRRSALTIVLPSGVARIGEGALKECPVLERIDLPPCLLSIGTDALRNCENLTRIRSFAVVPPALGEHAFDADFRENPLKIAVPRQSLADYAADPMWSAYSLEAIETAG